MRFSEISVVMEKKKNKKITPSGMLILNPRLQNGIVTGGGFLR